MKTALQFLLLLAENNNKWWFHSHKELYRQAREEFENFVKGLIERISEFDPRISGLEAKQTIFRINRDIRFSKDKSPYKLNFGALIAPGGRKSKYAGYYFHLEPDASFVGGGIYCPDKQVLDAIRTEIYSNPSEFAEIISSPTFTRVFGSLKGRKLKKGPKGFDTEFKYMEWIKFKDYIVSRNLTDQQVISENIENFAIETFKALCPFNQFLNIAVDKLLL